MKKTLVALVIIFSVALLSGCGPKKETENKNTEEQAKSEEKTQEQKQAEKKQKSENKSAVKSALEMVKAGDKLKCIYEIDNDGDKMQAVAFIEGTKTRSEISTGEGTTYSIFDGKTTYVWFGGQKAGTKMNVDCMESMDISSKDDQQSVIKENQKDQENEAEPVQDAKSLLKSAIGVKCEKVDSIDFNAPGDIDFADQCELLKKQSEMMKNIPDMQNP